MREYLRRWRIHARASPSLHACHTGRCASRQRPAGNRRRLFRAAHAMGVRRPARRALKGVGGAHVRLPEQGDTGRAGQRRQAPAPARQGGVAIIDTRPTGHEFDFWGYAFAIPLAALQQAFPAGPLSVPAAPVSHQVEIEFKKRSHVTAWRLVDGEIRYRIVTPSEPSLEGSYRAGLLPELPGDFDLRGWYIAPSPQRLGAPPQAPQPAPVERLEQLR